MYLFRNLAHLQPEKTFATKLLHHLWNRGINPPKPAPVVSVEKQPKRLQRSPLRMVVWQCD